MPFELFNVWSAKPDWILDTPDLRITGTTTSPTLPGPSPLHVTYADRPKGLVTNSQLVVRRLDVARVRIEGAVEIDGRMITLTLDEPLVT
jgi:hypothetical protein